jgi:predicted nucleotidyltransferase
MHCEGTGAEQGEAVLEEAVTASKETLGARLLAAYALGSLAHGGFAPLASDVDLGLVLADPPTTTDEEMIQLVRA